MTDTDPPENDPAAFIERLAQASATEHSALKPILRQARIDLSEAGWQDMVAGFAARIEDARSALLSPLTGSSEDKPNHTVESFFGEVLGALGLPLEPMIGLVAAALDERRDGNSWTVLSGFEQWCKAAQGRPRASVERIAGGDGPAALLAPALRAGFADDEDWHRARALDLLEREDSEAAAIAGDVLAGDAQCPEHTVDRVLAAALARLPELHARDHTRLFDAVIGLALRARPARMPDVLACADGQGIDTCRRAAAHHLAIARGRPDERAARALLEFVTQGEAIEPLAMDLLDDALRRWLPDEEPAGPFFDTLVALIGRSDVGNDQLDSCMHALLRMPTDKRDRVFGRILVQAGLAGADAVASLAHRQISKQLEPVIDFAPYDLDAADAEAIIRRVTGLVSLAPRTAIAILLSMLRTGPAGVREEAEALIFDPLLISFWEDGRAYLASRIDAEEPDVKARVEGLVARLDDYITAVRGVGFIDELYPSQSNRYLAALKRANDNRAINKQAAEGSIWGEIFPMRLILNGDSAVFRVFDGDGIGKRAEQEMQAQEFSQPLPRLDAIDPFGFWYRRRLMINGRNL